MERFLVGQLQYKQNAQKTLKVQRSQGRQKIKVFPLGTYMTQYLIPKISTIFYSIAKGISKIYQLERELGLSEVIQRHQSSVIHSFIFIHSLMRKMTKMYLQSFVNFTRNKIRGTHLVFSKEEISRFHIWNFESGRSLGRKVHFFKLLWDNQNFQESQTFCLYQCCTFDKFSRTI